MIHWGVYEQNGIAKKNVREDDWTAELAICAINVHASDEYVYTFNCS